jgi:hypothetical protein
VPPGRWTVRVRRLGFRPADVEVTLGTAGAPQVSLGLATVSVRLAPVTVDAAAPATFARRAPDRRAVRDARRLALAARRVRLLATDARELTWADVADGVTLGETDLLRALQRLPGVSTPHDLSAVLWTRGARWDQTRVTWDGLPLWNPVHAGGLLSAVDADAVGEATLAPRRAPRGAR